MGLSIVGGSDHSSHPFGVQDPGVFISKVSRPGRQLCRKQPTQALKAAITAAWSTTGFSYPAGASSGPSCSLWPSGWGPHPSSERAGCSGGHTSRGSQCPAQALPGAMSACAEGPTTPRHAGTLYPEGPWGEAGYQHPRRRQGSRREPL